MPLTQQSAVIFGATGAIGQSLGEALAQDPRYARIHVGGRTPPRSTAANVIPFAFDLLDESSIAAAAGSLPSAPDLVIVATGLLHDPATGMTPEKSLGSITAEALSRLFTINAIGPALIAKHILPRLPKDRPAKFVALSARVGSIADNHLGGWYAYRASKAALNMLIRTLAIETARTHPNAVVAALHPGTVATPLSAPFQRNVAPERLFTPETAAARVLDVISALTPADSGHLYAWNGERLPW